MKQKHLVTAGIIVLAVIGLYLFNTRIGGSADVLPADPAYADGSAIDSSIDSVDSQVDSSVDQDLSDIDSDSSAF